MSKFTNGPWRYSPAGRNMRDNYSQSFAVAQDGEPNLIAGCFIDVRGGDDVARANARLIAAAPDLLDICKRQREELRLIRMKDCGAVYDTTVRVEADMAISKAEA